MSGYKGVASIRPIEKTVDFEVDVELTSEPSDDWKKELAKCASAAVFCPAIEVKGATVTFVSRWSSIRSRLDALRRAMQRATAHVAGKEAVTTIGKPKDDGDRPGGAVTRLESLKKDGY